MKTTTFFEPVQGFITKVEDLMRAQGEDTYPELAAALEHLLASGGKRVRPAVSLLTGGMLGAEPGRIITLAAAIEMLHTATLVHDDLIDGSLLRRGIPTINAQWSPAATVLTGDFIFAKAARLAAQTESVEVMSMFAQTLATIVDGEIKQLFNSKGQANREDYYHRIHAKTASLFELAAGAAALLSPVGEDGFEKVRCYGYEVGMAFQIVDDILDFTGEQATIGKPVASDLRQGLITLPALIFMEQKPDNADMKAILNGNLYDEQRLNRLVQEIRESGAIQQSMEEARKFVKRGLRAIEDLPEGEEHQALVDMANYFVQRKF